MICPTCNHKFPLTWTRYRQALFDYHTCPSCRKRFKLAATAWYSLALVLVAAIFGSLPALIVFFVTTNVYYGLVTSLVLSFAIVLPLDRWLGDKYRRAEPID
jgi:VIT1/CCC1 family predicted Fe2+/Mn2+ transporter